MDKCVSHIKHAATEYRIMDALFADDEDVLNAEENGQNVEESDDESKENEESQQPTFIKPSFVPKSVRGTLASRDPQNILADVDDERQQLTEARRIARNRSAVAESLRKSEDTKDLDNFDSDSDAGMPEDVSDYDDDVEVMFHHIFQFIFLTKYNVV